MNKRCGWFLSVCACLCGSVSAQATQPAQRVPPTFSPLTAQAVSVQSQHMANAGAQPMELVCPRKGPAPGRPTMAPAEPTEIPGDADIEQALKEARPTLCKMGFTSPAAASTLITTRSESLWVNPR